MIIIDIKKRGSDDYGGDIRATITRASTCRFWVLSTHSSASLALYASLSRWNIDASNAEPMPHTREFMQSKEANRWLSYLISYRTVEIFVLAQTYQ